MAEQQQQHPSTSGLADEDTRSVRSLRRPRTFSETEGGVGAVAAVGGGGRRGVAVAALDAEVDDPAAARASLVASSAAPALDFLSADRTDGAGSAHGCGSVSGSTARPSFTRPGTERTGIRAANAAASRAKGVPPTSDAVPSPAALTDDKDDKDDHDDDDDDEHQHKDDQDSVAEEQQAANRKWRERKKHVFILTSAGRPVFTRWGDAHDFVELFGLLQTLVSLVHTANEHLRRVSMGSHQMHFLASGELTLVMVCATGETARMCQEQLRMLEWQLLSVLPNVNLILDKRPGFDVRDMFNAGDVRVMHNLIRRMSNEAGYMMQAPPTLTLPTAAREALIDALYDGYQGSASDDDYDEDEEGADNGDHLYTVLLAGGRVAGLIQPYHHQLPVRDLLLLVNVAQSVLASNSGGEVWAPVCLPGVNDTGYLWCYVRALTADVLLVHVASSQNKFDDLRTSTTRTHERLQVEGLLDVVDGAGRAPWPELPPPLLLNAPGLEFLLATDKRQLTMTRLPPHVTSKAHRKAFYRRLSSLRDTASGSCTGSNPFLVAVDSTEAVVVELSGPSPPPGKSGSGSSSKGAASNAALVDTMYASEIFAVFEPATSRADMQRGMQAVRQHLKANHTTLFLPLLTWTGDT